MRGRSHVLALGTMWSRTRIPLFRLVALLEGLSWLGLLAGMYAKYLTDAGEGGVKLFGPIHGGIFIAYVLLTVLVGRAQRWSPGTVLLGLACSVPPFATVLFEVWAQRTGRLAARGAEVAGAQEAVLDGASAS